jgi:hypothetical protein
VSRAQSPQSPSQTTNHKHKTQNSNIYLYQHMYPQIRLMYNSKAVPVHIMKAYESDILQQAQPNSNTCHDWSVSVILLNLFINGQKRSTLCMVSKNVTFFEPTLNFSMMILWRILTFLNKIHRVNLSSTTHTENFKIKPIHNKPHISYNTHKI